MGHFPETWIDPTFSCRSIFKDRKTSFEKNCFSALASKMNMGLNMGSPVRFDV